MDNVNFMEVLGMTDRQVLAEIRFMRAWDEFLKDEIGADEYTRCAKEFARIGARDALTAIGASEEEADEACDAAENL